MLKSLLDRRKQAGELFENEQHYFRNRLPAALRQLRRQMKLSQATFGQLLGVTPTYVSQLERGRAVPSMELVERCAELEDNDEG